MDESSLLVFVQNRHFMLLFDSIRAHQWRIDTRCMYTKSPVVPPSLMGSIFNGDFFENEMVEFVENLKVTS